MEADTKILVVDDEPDLEHLIRQKFRRHISNGEFSMSFARNGSEALEQLKEDDEIDILLTDLNMPSMDGLTLLSRLSELDRFVTPVVISAYGDMENIRSAMNRGSFDFLTKPIDLNDLEITLRKAVETMRTRREAEYARETFGVFVSDEVADELLSSPGGLELGGEIRTVTLLMADIRGFTAATEDLPPQVVVDVLNSYLGQMVDVIGAFGGTIDNFMGDGILVVFGAPLHMDDDCFRAAACAIAMQQAMEQVNVEIGGFAVRPISMGIGIHTGNVVVGNIGSSRRMKYSVVGSAVNLVSRVESATVGGQILISDDATRELQGRIDIQKSLSLRVKGFAEEIIVHELVGVGHPYNLTHNVGPFELVYLEQPMHVVVTLLQGKNVSSTTERAQLVALSDGGGLLRLSRELPVLTDMRITPEGQSTDGVDILYAKVVGSRDDLVEIRFTGMSPEIADLLEQLQT